jgi:hypothetical protein
MEGVLEKMDYKSGLFSGKGTYKDYHFILHEDILMFTEIHQKQTIKGKIHMQVTKILKDESNDLEIRLNTGLVDLNLRCKNISDKIKWKNALS